MNRSRSARRARSRPRAWLALALCLPLLACDDEDSAGDPLAPEDACPADGAPATDAGGAEPDMMATPATDAGAAEPDMMAAEPCDPAYDPPPLGDAPPLPDDACPNPPTALGRGFEAAVRNGQDQTAQDQAALLDLDAFTVVTCGTGSPLSADRAQACTAVFAGGQFLVFDSGDGAQRAMEDQGLPVAAINAVFLTHYHSDHLADVGETISRSWILGRTTALPIYGGPGIERVVDGFNLVYTPDEGYRREHHGEGVFPADALLPGRSERVEPPPLEGRVVYDVGGVVVRAFPVDHAPVTPALGYRVEFQGRSVAITGDTIDTPGLRSLVQDADLVVSEVIDLEFTLEGACAFERLDDPRNTKIFRDIRTYHVGVDALGQVAADAGIGTLVLTHLVPGASGAQAESRFAAPIREVFAGEVVVAEDGMRFPVLGD